MNSGKFRRFNFDSGVVPTRTDSGAASSVSSLPQPPPSPGLSGFPQSIKSMHQSTPAPSPGFFGFTPAINSVARPSPSPGFAGLKLAAPPQSPRRVPPSIYKSPPSPRPAPLELSRPPMSPGFAPPKALSKPPPSPGFGAHRFGDSGGFGFVSLNLGSPPKPVEKKETAASERHVTIMRGFPDDAALLSPRAETMTNNPIHQAISGIPGMQIVEVPPTPTDGVFSPRETIFPRDPFYPFGRPIQVADPRSPPTKGESPIVRSIDDML